MKRFLLALAVTGVLVALLLRPIRLQDIGDLLAALRWPFFAAALVCYAFQYLFRTLRLRVLTRSASIPLAGAYGVVCLHNLFNYLLPMRSGEISYPVLARRYLAVPMAEGVGVLLVARLLDLLSILSLFMLSVILLSGRLLQVNTPLTLASSLVFLVGIFLLLKKLGALLGRLCGGLERIGGKVRSPRIRTGTAAIARKTREVIRVLEPLSRGRYLFRGLAYSFLVWISFAGTCSVLMMGFGLETSFPAVLFGASATAVTGVLPVSGLGNFGTMEAGWSVALWLTGMPKEDAIASAFGIHIFVLAYVGILALAGAAVLLVATRGHRRGSRTGRLNGNERTPLDE